jgi:hypothetical protein
MKKTLGLMKPVLVDFPPDMLAVLTAISYQTEVPRNALIRRFVKLGLANEANK